MDFDRKYRLFHERLADRAARSRARELFVAAGRPVPAWAEEPAPAPVPLDPSVCIESDDELLVHPADCQCVRCRSDIEETATEGRCDACGASPLGGPGDEAEFCRDCAAAMRELEREERQRGAGL